MDHLSEYACGFTTGAAIGVKVARLAQVTQLTQPVIGRLVRALKVEGELVTPHVPVASRVVAGANMVDDLCGVV